MSRLVVWVGVLCIVCIGLAAGCKERNGVDPVSLQPAQEAFMPWKEHQKSFSIVAVNAPREAVQYRFETRCPLRYGFAFERRVDIVLVKEGQTRREPGSLVRIWGELLGRVPSDAQKRWAITMLWGRTKATGDHEQVSPSQLALYAQEGELLLKNDGFSLELASGRDERWEGKQGSLFLSLFWPELSTSATGHHKNISKKVDGGTLTARSETRHWLFLRGERVAIMADIMRVSRPHLQIEQDASYAMLARGHLLHSYFVHRHRVELQTSRGRHTTHTSVRGELRLLHACHALTLPPFVSQLSASEQNQKRRILKR